MPRAEYDVQKGAPTPADTSFRSCVLAILIFIILCLIFVLLAVGLRSSRSPEPRAAVSHSHRDSEKVNEQGRIDEKLVNEDIETLPKNTTTTTTTTTTTPTTTPSRRPTSATKHPAVTTTEHPGAAARNATSEHSQATTVAVVVSNATTAAPVSTASPESQQPITAAAPSSEQPVAQTTLSHNRSGTHPPPLTKATTVRPLPPLILLEESSSSSDIPPSYLPSSVSPITIDLGRVESSNAQHSTAPNTTSEYSDTEASVRTTPSPTLRPRDNSTDRTFLGPESTNDSSTLADNVTDASPTPADHVESKKSFASSITTTTAKTTDEVVTETNVNATDGDRSHLERLLMVSPSDEQTTDEIEATSTSRADDGLLVATNDSSLTTPASEPTAAGLNQTSGSTATPAHEKAVNPPVTTVPTSWTNDDDDNSSVSSVLASSYTRENIAETVSSMDSSDRDVESVPPTTTAAVTTINRTTTATSEHPTTTTSPGHPTTHLQPVVPKTRGPESTVCHTDACYRQAQRMAAMMNHTVQPCSNFYVTACGGLQNDPQLMQYDSQQEAFARIADVTRSSEELPSAIKKMREFEKSCMQYGRHMPNAESRIAEVRRVMNNIGNFSFDDGEWKNFRSKFADLFSTLIKYNSSPLFDVLLDVESKNKPTFVFKLVPPLPGGSLFSGDRMANECRRRANQDNKNKIDMNNKHALYRNCKKYDIFSNTVELVKVLGYNNGANKTAAEKFNESLAYALNDLYVHLEQIPNEATIRHEQFTKKFKLTTVAEMDKKFTLIDWKRLFKNLVEEHHESIGEQVVQIYSIDHFSYIFEELADRAESEHAFAKDLNNALLAYAAQRLVEDFVEQHSSCNREAYCQYVAYSLMSQAASSAYLQSFNAVERKRMEDRANETFTLLKDTLNDEFKNAKWLDEESRTEVFDQLGKIQLAPYNWESFILNNTYLDDYYKELHINSTNYFQNAINLVLLNKKHSYSLYLKNPLQPQYIWSHFKYPYHNTGNVIYALNTVVIPIGLLSKFSNDAPLPKYINMAGEGLVMAHELAHMFDFVGIKREFHNTDLKLSSHSASVFVDMEMCVKSEYDFKKSHQAEDGNLIEFQTNGALSANERMADYTGMLIAYHTYLKHWGNSEELLPLISSWTPKQLFFLQAAQELCSKKKIYHHFVEIFEDVHLPSAIRVQNMVSNSAEFSEVFSCPKRLLCDVFPRNEEPDMNYPLN